MEVVLKYINISNKHVLHLQLMKCYILSQFLKERDHGGRNGVREPRENVKSGRDFKFHDYY